MSPQSEPQVPEVIRRIANSADRRLAWEFFVFFSRFEYALKRDGRYLLPGTGNAKPDWDRFALDYKNAFDPSANPDLLAAIEYFRRIPPRKQMRENGEMKWSDPTWHDDRHSLLVWLLKVVRIVRNNLFHGGKFPLIPISDPSRDRDLMANAVVILEACLRLDHRVQETFVEGIDE